MRLLFHVLFFVLNVILVAASLSDLILLEKFAAFPPVVPDVPGEPKGHKKPLGWQRGPEHKIKEYTEPLNANDFWRLHVKDHIPLVYRGYLKESPAISLWSDEYLMKKYGDLDVLVEHKLEDRTSTSGRMRLRDFLKNYKDQDMYIVSMFPSEMMHEVKAIPSVLCGTFKEYTHESNLWVSSGGTRSVVHYDADHNLHCLIDGRKDFIMINNNLTTKTNLYFKRKDPGVGSGFSFLDPDTIDMHKFKNIAKVPWTYATLYPGDCIYIPSMYIHQVRGYGRTLAITTLFTADVKNNFNGDDCTEEIMKKYHSMADIKFQWTYKKGDKTIDMGYQNVELVKEGLIHSMTDRRFTKNGTFTKRQFVMYSGVFSPYARNKTKMGIMWNDVFGLSDEAIMDKKMLNSFNLEQWKAYCRAIEVAHGVVTNGSEPVFVRPGERHKWEMEHPDGDEDDHMMTEKERRIKMASHRDPMFDYLSPEEKKEYIKKNKERKAKYGQTYHVSEEEVEAGGEIPWRLDDVPEQYRAEVSAGKIPEGFKEEFISNLPDQTKEQFAKELAANKIPNEVLSVLKVEGYDSYAEIVARTLNGEDREDDEFEGDWEDSQGQEADEDDQSPEGENSDQFPFSFYDLDAHRQKAFLKGEVPKGDAKDLLQAIPTKYRNKYGEEIKQNKMPKKLLLALLGSTEETFEKDITKIKKNLVKAKDEL